MVEPAPPARGPHPADVDIARVFAADLAARLSGRLQRAILFGSRARGDALPGSDWDVLVLVDAYDRETRRAVSEAAWERDPAFIDVQIFTPERWAWSQHAQAPLLKHALAEGVAVWPETTTIGEASSRPT